MELSPGNSLYNYFKQTKMPFSFFFFLTKMENRRAEQILSGRLVPVRGRGCGERV
jgi:hypothetical protein